MQFCTDHGIPHSQFLDWDLDDRAKTTAYLMEANARCDMCGTAEWEWDENPFAYEAVDEFCKGCYMKSVYSDQEKGGLPGTNVKLIPVTPMRKAERIVKAKKMAAMQRRDRAKEAESVDDGRSGAPGRRDPDRGHLGLPAERQEQRR